MSEIINSTAKTAYAIAFSRIINLLVYGLTFIYIARTLGPEQYGLYNIALSVAGLLAGIGSFGLSTYGERVLSREEDKKKLDGAFTVLLLIVLILTIVSLFILPYLFHSSAHTNDNNYLIIIAIIATSLAIILNFLQTQFIGLRLSKDFLIISILYTSLQSILSIILLILGYGVNGVITAFFMALLISNIYAFYNLKKRVNIKFCIKSMRLYIKEMFQFSYPLTVSNILGSVTSNMGIVFLGIFYTSFIVGEYSIALQIGSIISLIISSIGASLLPLFSKSIENNKNARNAFNYSIFFAFLVGLPFSLYGAITSTYIVDSLFPNYQGANILVALISIGILFTIYPYFIRELLVAYSKTKDIMLASIISAILLIPTIPLFSYLFGAIGLIFLFYIINNIILSIFFKIRTNITIEKIRILKLIMTNLLLSLFILLLYFVNLEYTIKLIIGILEIVVVYPILLSLFHVLNEKDIDILTKATNKVPILENLFNMFLKYEEYIRNRLW